MPIITLMEVIDLIIMTLGLGYIFSSYIKQPETELSLVKKHDWFDKESFKLATYVTVPAVIFHELSHKIVAMLFGLQAVFHASYAGLGIGIFLKLIASPFIIFTPGYVSISASTPLQSALTALAGPLTNLALWGLAWLLLNYSTKLTRNQAVVLHLTKQINMFLFIFNMIPIGPFDGAKVLQGLISSF